VLATTADTAMIRFHGRNADTWEAKNISPAERFKYLYSEREVEGDLVPAVLELARAATTTHALFNNCYADYGVQNGRQLANMLRDAMD
jgi:uncharacterized protein YecE (DUF72 family)